MVDREEIHRVVDRIPARGLPALRDHLRSLIDREDPVPRLFDEAPTDDEPVGPEEAHEMTEAWADDQTNGGVRLDDIKHAFGR